MRQFSPRQMAPLFAIASIVSLGLLSFLAPSESMLRHLLLHTAEVGAAVFVAWSVLSSRRDIPTHQERLSWALIGAYVLLTVFGDSLWVFQVVVLHRDDPFPSIADIPYLLAYLFLWTGLLHQPSAQTRESAGRAVLILEMLISVLSVATLLWFFSIGPTLQQSESLGTLEKILSITYPLLDVATLVCVIVLLFRSHLAAFWRPRTLLAVAAVSLVLADTLFVYFEFHDSYTTSDWLDLLWLVSNLAFGVAALAAASVYRQGVHLYPDVIVLPSRWRVALPYLLIVSASATMVSVFLRLHLDSTQVGLMIGTVLVFFIVLLRQSVSFEETRRLYAELRDAYQQMAQQAHTDPITRLPNYRVFTERLADEFNRSQRYGTPLALLFADLDHFKTINDTHGHMIGDSVLHSVAATLREHIRMPDFVARYAGEEFVIVLPQTSTAQALPLAERLRQAIDTMPLALADGTPLHLTISIGVAACPDSASSIESLIGQADAAMYAAKRSGRNRVCAASPLEHPLPVSQS